MYSSDLTAFGKKCCYFFVPFWCLVFDIFWCCVLDLVIFSTYFNHVNGAKCLIHINLCTFHVKKNSTRLQWYSCARYKAPGPLVLYFYTVYYKAIPFSGNTSTSMYMYLNYLSIVDSLRIRQLLSDKKTEEFSCYTHEYLAKVKWIPSLRMHDLLKSCQHGLVSWFFSQYTYN